MGIFHKWISIENLAKVSEIFSAREVNIAEKIHGISVRFGSVNGRLRIGSRTQEFDFDYSAPSSGLGFLGWFRGTRIPQKIKEVEDKLGKNFILYGEWFGEGIQKGVRYVKEGKDFRSFGLMVDDDLMDWDLVQDISDKLGVKTAPLLYCGEPNRSIFDILRMAVSETAKDNGIRDENNLAEGIVISAVPMRRTRHSWLIAKYKNPKFEERKSGQGLGVKTSMAIPENAKDFVEEFWTAQRLEHVLTVLREEGNDVGSPNIMGKLIPLMFEDVLKEGQDEWQKLSSDEKRAVGRLHPQKTKELLSFTN